VIAPPRHPSFPAYAGDYVLALLPLKTQRRQNVSIQRASSSKSSDQQTILVAGDSMPHVLVCTIANSDLLASFSWGQWKRGHR